jgi:uncharacterized protein YdbL (DUF1318 family)
MKTIEKTTSTQAAAVQFSPALLARLEQAAKREGVSARRLASLALEYALDRIEAGQIQLAEPPLD